MRVQHLWDIQGDYWHTPGWAGSPISNGGVSRVHLLREGAKDWLIPSITMERLGARLWRVLVDLHQWPS